MVVSELVSVFRSNTSEVFVVVASFSLLVIGFDEEDSSQRQEEACDCRSQIETVPYDKGRMDRGQRDCMP